jgi:charged multivesicular body protein 5
MESAALTTENLQNTMATVHALGEANKVMRKQYGKIDLDKIEVSAGFLTHCVMTG